MPNKKNKTLFDHLKVITSKQNKSYFKSLSDGDKKSWSNYMINRFLSMKKEYIHVVNLIQQYTLPEEMLYRFYIDILPRNNVFLKYIKAKNTNNFPTELVELLSKHFYVSKKEAEEYIEILIAQDDIEEIDTICSLYGIDEDDRKKWIKKLRDEN